MKYLNWDSDKNELLKKNRGVSFEEVAIIIEANQIIGVEENRGRGNQKMYIVNIDNYAVVVPFVETENEIFLKTIFPSRKFTKKYGLRSKL
jgi:uncharacterized DUF497 family protein